MNEKDEDLIKKLFIDKLLKTKQLDTYFVTKIFEEYVKCKNAVNIYIQANGTQNNINNTIHRKNKMALKI